MAGDFLFMIHLIIHVKFYIAKTILIFLCNFFHCLILTLKIVFNRSTYIWYKTKRLKNVDNEKMSPSTSVPPTNQCFFPEIISFRFLWYLSEIFCSQTSTRLSVISSHPQNKWYHNTYTLLCILLLHLILHLKAHSVSYSCLILLMAPDDFT